MSTERNKMVIFMPILLGIGTRLAYSLIGGIFLMFAVGVIHHEWIESCPTIGYWWAVVLSFLITMALTFEVNAKLEARR